MVFSLRYLALMAARKLAEDPDARAKAADLARRAGRVRAESSTGAGRTARKPAKDPDTIALERDLTTLLGLKVNIEILGNGGALTVHYQTLEQLDEVLRRLNHAPPPEVV